MRTEELIRQRFKQAIFSKEQPSIEGMIMQGIGLLLGAQGDLPSKDFVKDIIAFHQKYNQEYSGPPRSLPKTLDWRPKFLKEELKEYTDAVRDGNRVKQFDALLDILFVAFGTMYLQGFPIEEGWEIVFSCNMTKDCVRNGEGKWGATVSKGPNFVPPEPLLQAILDRQDDLFKPEARPPSSLPPNNEPQNTEVPQLPASDRGTSSAGQP